MNYPNYRCCECGQVRCYGPWSRCDECYQDMLARGEPAVGARNLLPQRPWLTDWYEPTGTMRPKPSPHAVGEKL